MKQRIVEGGCTEPRISRLGCKLLTKRDEERLGARIDHFAWVVSWPWRTLRRLLPRVRPGA
jgi:hypothetical protein